MARYTHEVLQERDLAAMLRDHMAQVESKLDAALFTGATPLLDEKLEPWTLTLLVELAVRHTKSAEIPRMAVMMIVAKTLGIETLPAAFLNHLSGHDAPGVASSIGAQLAAQAQARAAAARRPTGGALPENETQAHVNDPRSLDFTGSGVDPTAKVRVVKAANVTETVMNTLADHPLTKDAFDGAERAELESLFATLCEKITAMIEQRLM